MKKKIPIGTSNYRELRIQDYYTVDTRCAQERKFGDKGFSRMGEQR